MKFPRAIYQSADEIEERIRQCERNSMHLSVNTDRHREIMKEIARLRIYAEAKRWMSGPAKKQA